MLKMLKTQVQGMFYLLVNPSQLKHLVLREARYKYRHQSKRKWIEWQKYNSSRIEAALKGHEKEALMRPFNIARIQCISDMVRPLGDGLNILDVGGGEGIIGESLWKLGNHITTLDLPTVATQAHRNQNLSAVTGDAERLPFKPETFDVVLASEIVEHLWDPHSFLDDAYRILKPHGHLIISTPEGKAGLRYDSHKHYFTTEIFEKLLASKFTLTDVKHLTNVGTPTPTIIVKFQSLND